MKITNVIWVGGKINRTPLAANLHTEMMAIMKSRRIYQEISTIWVLMTQVTTTWTMKVIHRQKSNISIHSEQDVNSVLEHESDTNTEENHNNVDENPDLDPNSNVDNIKHHVDLFLHQNSDLTFTEIFISLMNLFWKNKLTKTALNDILQLWRDLFHKPQIRKAISRVAIWLEKKNTKNWRLKARFCKGQLQKLQGVNLIDFLTLKSNPAA